MGSRSLWQKRSMTHVGSFRHIDWLSNQLPTRPRDPTRVVFEVPPRAARLGPTSRQRHRRLDPNGFRQNQRP
jgi:hypothetical protein